MAKRSCQCLLVVEARINIQNERRLFLQALFRRHPGIPGAELVLLRWVYSVYYKIVQPLNNNCCTILLYYQDAVKRSIENFCIFGTKFSVGHPFQAGGICLYACQMRKIAPHFRPKTAKKWGNLLALICRASEKVVFTRVFRLQNTCTYLQFSCGKEKIWPPLHKTADKLLGFFLHATLTGLSFQLLFSSLPELRSLWLHTHSDKWLKLCHFYAMLYV